MIGETGKPDTDQAGELTSQGFPPDVPTGISGLERAFNSTLAGGPAASCSR